MMGLRRPAALLGRGVSADMSGDVMQLVVKGGDVVVVDVVVAVGGRGLGGVVVVVA